MRLVSYLHSVPIMKLVSYSQSVPVGNVNPQKTQLLYDFVTGVNASGDEGILHDGRNIIPADVALIQGWVYTDTMPNHLKLRHDVIRTQKSRKNRTLVADANLFLYHDKMNPQGYLRYSFDGIFPTTGNYFDSLIDKSRWQSISKNTGITLQPIVKNGQNIVLMCQRQGGWSMKGYDLITWIQDTVSELRKHTDRRIIIRPHPGDRRALTYTKKYKGNPLFNLPNVIVREPGQPPENDLDKAWAVVNHNSSSVVGPIIQGYHSFITDPDDSQCREVSNTNFSKIESPDLFDRESWLERISMSHWSFEELRTGAAWRHIRNFV